jgi:hypothetical protein
MTNHPTLFGAATPSEEWPFVVEAHRGAGSMFGAAVALVKGKDGQPMRFATMADAEAQAKKWNRGLVTANVYYVARYLGEGR